MNSIVEIVGAAIDEVNNLLPPGERLNKSPETAVLGDHGVLDSMGIVNLVIALEQGVKRSFGRPVCLTGDPNVFAKDGVLRTVGSMTEFVRRTVDGQD